MKNKEEIILKREDGLLKNEKSWRRARIGAAFLFAVFLIAMLFIYRENLTAKDERAKTLTAVGIWCFFWLLLISWLNLRIQYIDSINRYRKKNVADGNSGKN